MNERIGLIAGAGVLPVLLAREAHSRGMSVVAVALDQLADPSLVEVCESVAWIGLGELDRMIQFLKGEGIHQLVMAGKVDKRALATLQFDARAKQLLASLPDFKDMTILKVLADALGREGLALLPPESYMRPFLAAKGPMGKRGPTPEESEDISFGVPVASRLAGLDIGHCVVVKNRMIVAVEALEGTDAVIRRGGDLVKGPVIIKMSRPEQDLRLDPPVVGKNTIAVMGEAGATCLAIEAGKTLVLDRDQLVLAADGLNIAVVGI